MKKTMIQSNVFDSSNLSGKISWLDASQGAVRFQLNNADEVYWFDPRMEARNGYADFGRLAETQDSIYKRALADTLILVKVITRRVYKFTFHRIDN